MFDISVVCYRLFYVVFLWFSEVLGGVRWFLVLRGDRGDERTIHRSLASVRHFSNRPEMERGRKRHSDLPLRIPCSVNCCPFFPGS